jgi:hypothetical protein
MSRPALSVPDPTPDAEHNYIPAMFAWLARNPPPPGLKRADMQTLHDDWCGIWRGRRCHCRPTFRWAVDPGRN